MLHLANYEIPSSWDGYAKRQPEGAIRLAGSSGHAFSRVNYKANAQTGHSALVEGIERISKTGIVVTT